MTQRSQKIDRRTVLRGAGVACALPWLEAMSHGAQAARQSGRDPSDAGGDQGPAKRLCFVYFPNGAGLPPKNDPAHEQWGWFPHGAGADYRPTKVLEPLAPYRDQLTILGGYSHPKSRRLLGHLAGDTWLTGGDLRGSAYLNTISADQVAAAAIGRTTRYRSLVFSTDGGVGYKSRISTLSFAAGGRPIPAEHRQRAIFERYFGGPSGPSEDRRRASARNKKIVDMVLEDAGALRRGLGGDDAQRLDEYLEAVSGVEEQIRSNERWSDVPITLPSGGPIDGDAGVDLNIAAAVDPAGYLRAMFDLLVLAFQTDMTRVATFMMAREDGMGFGENFPKLALGIEKGHHTISHDKSQGHWEEWGRYDRWLTEQFAHFVKRLQESHDQHGPLLDRTLVMYGSACSTTHNANNYPTVLAGGSALGMNHGQYRIGQEHGHDAPMGNVLLTLLHTAGVPVESFAQSTGVVDGLVG
ncbi:MAG: DUF1552 domain-containing protein [Planctomycetota bacterium]